MNSILALSKRLSFLIIIACFAFCSLQIDAQDGQALYNMYSPEVVILQHQLYIDGMKTSCASLWKRWEDQIEDKFLSTYITVSSGSGFFIDYDGHLLTNSHVADIGAEGKIQDMLFQGIAKSVDNMALIFTNTERDQMKRDLRTLLEHSTYRFNAMRESENLGSVIVLAKGDPEKDDIALARIEGVKSEPLPLSADLDVDNKLTGLDVYSMGYPLGDSLQYLNKQRVVTMNRGNISAYRENAKYDIQHSASISSGNSGGPLVLESGLVCGMNTAMITKENANSLFYAISSKRIRKFLRLHGYDKLLLWGDRRLAMNDSGFSGLNKNRDGEYESPSMLVVSVGDDVTISLNGKIYGTGKQVVTLSEPLNELLISSRDVNERISIRFNPKLKGPVVFSPTLKNSTAEIQFTSEPAGRRVYADLRLLGTTPFTVNLPKGTYSVVTENDSTVFSQLDLEINDLSPKNIHLVGVKAYPVTFLDTPKTERLQLRFSGDSGTYLYDSVANVFLPEGEYSLDVQGIEGLKNVKIPVSVSDTGTEINLEEHQIQISFSVKGFVPGTRIFIDGKEKQEVKSDSIHIAPGEHLISLWHEDWKPLISFPITVDPSKVNYITWNKKTGDRIYMNRFLWSGIVLGTVGVLSTGVGLYYGQNSLIMKNTNNYEEYKSWKDKADMAMVTGVSTMFVATISELLSLWYKQKYNEKKKEFGL